MNKNISELSVIVNSAPRRAPLLYPGKQLITPALVEVGGAGPANLTALRIISGLGIEKSVTKNNSTLADTLDELGYPPMSGRTPVLAIGSNACIAQMSHKYISKNSRVAYPQIMAEVTGLDIGYAPTTARYGSVPATVVPRPNYTIQVAVQFLDEETLEELDATEGGSKRVTLSREQGVEVSLPNGGTLKSVEAYVASSGYLIHEDGSPWLLGEGDERLSQKNVMELLLEAASSRYDAYTATNELVSVPEQLALCADGTQLSAVLREGIINLGQTKPSAYIS